MTARILHRYLKGLGSSLTLSALVLLFGCNSASNSSPGSFGLTISPAEGDGKTFIVDSIGNEIKAKVVNDSGEAVDGIQVVFAVVEGNNLILQDSIAITDKDGFAKTSFKAPSTPSAGKISAQIANTSAAALFTINAVFGEPPKLSKIEFVSGSEPPAQYQAAVRKMPAMPVFRIQLKDQYGHNFIPADPTQVKLDFADGSGNEALLNGTKILSVSQSDGTAAFTDIRYPKTGSATLRVSVVGHESDIFVTKYLTVIPNVPYRAIALVPGQTPAIGGMLDYHSFANGSPTRQKAGVGFNVVVYIVDEASNITPASGNLALVSSKPGTTLIPSPTGTYANGVSTFAVEADALTTDASLTFTAQTTLGNVDNTNSGNEVDSPNIESAGINVDPGNPVKFGFLSSYDAGSHVVPGALVAAANPNPVLSAGILDRFGNVVASANSGITVRAYSDITCTTPLSETVRDINGNTMAAITGDSGTTVSGTVQFQTFSYYKARTLYLRAEATTTSSLQNSPCSNAMVVSAGPASRLSLTSTPNGGAAGVALTPPLGGIVTDTYGNPAASSGSPATVNANVFTDITCQTQLAGLTLDGLQSSVTGNSLSTSTGIASFTDFAVRRSGGPYYIQLSSGSFTSNCSSAINITPGSPAKLAAGVNPNTPQSADSAFGTQPSIIVQDAYGNPAVPAGSSSFEITLSAFASGSCNNRSSNQPINNVQSSSTSTVNFSTLWMKKAGTYRLQAALSSPSIPNLCLAQDTVINPGTAAKLGWSQIPSSVITAGVTLAGAQIPKVEIRDQFDNKTSDTFEIDLAAYSGNGCTTTIASTTPNGQASVDGPGMSANAIAGVASLSNVTIYLAPVGATVSFQASSPSLSNVFTACTTAVAINAGAPSALNLVSGGLPSSSQTAGQVFSPNLKLKVTDAYGNQTSLTRYGITASARTGAACGSTASGAGSITGNTKQTDSSGVATLDSLTYTKAEPIRIYAEVDGYPSANICVASAAGDSNFTVGPGSAEKINISTAIGAASAQAGQALGVTPTFEIADHWDNRVTAATTMNIVPVAYNSISVGADETTKRTQCAAAADLSSASSPAATRGVFTPSAATTPTAGVFTFASPTYTKVITGSGIRLKAMSTGLTSVCTDSLLTIAPGNAAAIAWVAAPPTTATVDVALSSITAEIQDAYQNRVVSDSNTMTLELMDASCVGSPYIKAPNGTDNSLANASAPAVNGLASFNVSGGLLITRAGNTLALRASSATLGSGVGSACSSTMSIAPGNLSQLTLSAGTLPTNTSSDYVMSSTNQTSLGFSAVTPQVNLFDSHMNTITSSITTTMSVWTNTSCTSAATSAQLSGQSVSSSASISGSALFPNLKYTKAETVYFKASAGSASQCFNGSPVAVNPGAPHHITFTTQPANSPSTAVAGTPLTTPPAVEIRDVSENRVTAAPTQNINLTVFKNSSCSAGQEAASLTPSGATALAATGSSASTTNGATTFANTQYNNVQTDNNNQIYFKATSTSAPVVSGCSNSVTFTGGAPTAIALLNAQAAPPASVQASSPINQYLKFTITDQYGNLAGGTYSMSVAPYAGTDTTCTGTQLAGQIEGNGSKSSNSGVFDYGALYYRKAEIVRLKASVASPALSLCLSQTTQVNAGTPVSLAFTRQPSTTGQVAGVIFSPIQPQVSVVDGWGNTCTNDSSRSIRLAAYAMTESGSTPVCSTTVAGTLGGQTTGNATAGLWEPPTGQELKFDKTPGLRLRVDSNNLTFACSDAISVDAANAQSLAFNLLPPTVAVVGANLPMKVAVVDQFGNVKTNFTSTEIDLKMTLGNLGDSTCANPNNNDATLHLAPQQTATGSLTAFNVPGGFKSTTSGVADYSGQTPNYLVSGSYRMRAYANLGTAGSPNVVGVCSPAITFTPGPAASISYLSQPDVYTSTTYNADNFFNPQPSLKVQDTYGNAVTGGTRVTLFPVTAASSCDGNANILQGTLDGPTADTDAGGNANFTATMYRGAGYMKLRASVVGAASTVLYSCSNQIGIAAGAPKYAKFIRDTSTGNTTTLGADSTSGIVKAGDTINSYGGAPSTLPLWSPRVIITDQYGNTYANDARAAGSAVGLKLYTDAQCTAAAPSTIANSVNNSSGQASIAFNAPTTTNNGTASFGDVIFRLAGTFWMKPDISGLTNICSTASTVVAPGIPNFIRFRDSLSNQGILIPETGSALGSAAPAGPYVYAPNTDPYLVATLYDVFGNFISNPSANWSGTYMSDHGAQSGGNLETARFQSSPTARTSVTIQGAGDGTVSVSATDPASGVVGTGYYTLSYRTPDRLVVEMTSGPSYTVGDNVTFKIHAKDKNSDVKGDVTNFDGRDLTVRVSASGQADYYTNSCGARTTSFPGYDITAHFVQGVATIDASKAIKFFNAGSSTLKVSATYNSQAISNDTAQSPSLPGPYALPTMPQLTFSAGTATTLRIVNASTTDRLSENRQDLFTYDPITSGRISNGINAGVAAFDVNCNPTTGSISNVTWGVSSNTASIVGTLSDTSGNTTSFRPVKSGDGTLTMSGKVGSTNLSDSAQIRVYVPNLQFPVYSSTLNDDANMPVLSTSQVTATKFWNTTLDSNMQSAACSDASSPFQDMATTCWRNKSTLSWYTESSSTRGDTNTYARSPKSRFPVRALLVGSNESFDIMDAAADRLWMSFVPGSGNAYDTDIGIISSISALNGRIFVGFADPDKNTSAIGGLLIVDFVNDKMFKFKNDSNGNPIVQVKNGISGRNSSSGWSSSGISPAYSAFPATLVVRSIDAVQIGTKDYLAIGSKDAIYMMKLDSSPAVLSLSAGNVAAVKLLSSGILYYAENGLGVRRADFSVSGEVSWPGAIPKTRLYAVANAVPNPAPSELAALTLPSSSYTTLDVSVAKSSASAGANLVLVGTSNIGLIALHEGSDLTNSQRYVYTFKGQGGTFVGRLAEFDGSSGYATLPHKTNFPYLAGTAEFWFRPDSDISDVGTGTAGVATLFYRGKGGASPTYMNGVGNTGIEFTGDGKMRLFSGLGSSALTITTANAYWSKGIKQHVAFSWQWASSGSCSGSNQMLTLALWVNGIRVGSAAQGCGDPTAWLNNGTGSSTPSPIQLGVGTAAFGNLARFYKGGINGLRISTNSTSDGPRYSPSSSTISVPNYMGTDPANITSSADSNAVVTALYPMTTDAPSASGPIIKDIGPSAADGNLINNAWCAMPLFEGTSLNIVGLQAITGSSTTAEITTQGSDGAWSELFNVHQTGSAGSPSSVASLNAYQTSFNGGPLSVMYPSVTAPDLVYTLQYNGLVYRRR